MRILLILLFISFNSFGQEFVSKKQMINTVNNKYVEYDTKIYLSIKDDIISLYTNKKMNKVFETHKIGITETDDWKIKWSYDTSKNTLTKRGVDTFTDKSYKMVYELSPIE